VGIEYVCNTPSGCITSYQKVFKMIIYEVFSLHIWKVGIRLKNGEKEPKNDLPQLGAQPLSYGFYMLNLVCARLARSLERPRESFYKLNREKTRLSSFGHNFFISTMFWTILFAMFSIFKLFKTRSRDLKYFKDPRTFGMDNLLISLKL